MKKTSSIFVLSLFIALITLTGCQQPSAPKEDPPLPPSAQQLISDSIYQTAFEGDNPKTASQLRFNKYGTYASVWSVMDYSSTDKAGYEQNKELLQKQNPGKKMEFDDTNQFIYMDVKFKYKTTDLLFFGFFSNDYRTYTMTNLKGDPEEVYEHQI